ncbi:histidine phosphatase family protein [Microlunatus sp. Gsoil 973]|uniref:histidine phosphatase family protein n=1 Tax=Microlunatus sp. Gsoil 973 TaxID=2672569 RepID=UPI0012B47182|nr:histidine phosphatase family protein [Microlunatus sp. Gsoil 973]QGN33577.1 histidine phosphatase family protein [Microlunatus sp. Gsoil 973]
MAMPVDLVLVRHGESEGNFVRDQARHGDDSGYTDLFATTPGRRWRLTPVGRDQARLVGDWLRAEFADGFDRHYVSPFARAKQTAGLLALPNDPRWYVNRTIRERDWGDIGSIPRQEFESRPEYQLNAKQQRSDPLYWVPPGGESIAHVAENRVRNFLETLDRELGDRRVVAVTHGEFIMAVRLLLERWDDEEYGAIMADPGQRLHTCEVLHYSRRDPRDGRVEGRLAWLRRAHPDLSGGVPAVAASPWARFDYRLPGNDELLDQS